MLPVEIDCLTHVHNSTAFLLFATAMMRIPVWHIFNSMFWTWTKIRIQPSHSFNPAFVTFSDTHIQPFNTALRIVNGSRICTFANNQHDLSGLSGQLRHTPFVQAILRWEWMNRTSWCSGDVKSSDVWQGMTHSIFRICLKCSCMLHATIMYERFTYLQLFISCSILPLFILWLVEAVS